MTIKLLSVLTGALCTLGLAANPSHAAAPTTAQKVITGKAFLNIAGTTVGNLTSSANFPDKPDVVQYLPYFEWAATGDIATPPADWADNYGAQIVGYFYPPTSGDYVFWIASDDNSALYLSPDSDSTHKKLIAQETSYSSAREFTTSAGGSVLTDKDSSQFAGTQWATKDAAKGGAKITLQAGQPYYIEALFKEGNGDDYLAVAVQDPGATIDSTLPIPGQYLSSDRSTGPVTIVAQPQSQTVNERAPATFRVTPDGTPPYTFAWSRNGTPITDATNIAYTLPSATMAENNAKFSVVVTGAQGSAPSQDAVLTVTPDTTVPKLVKAKGRPSLTEVVLTFSEPMQATSATATANYQISSSAGSLGVTAASLAASASGDQVTLTTAPQTLGTKYTVLVSNLKDTATTPNTIAANSKAVFFPMGKLKEINGFVVYEAENYDRNLDGHWVEDTQRGTPSGGASVVVPSGAGGSETATQLEYDVDFTAAGTYTVWFRASGNDGGSDSGWFHLDGEKPVERTDANSDSMTDFSGVLDFTWLDDSQDGPNPFTVDIATAGHHVLGLALREEGAYFDKFILTTDGSFTPTGLGPTETREGAPGLPTVSLTGPASGQKYTAGDPITLTATAAGASGLNIDRVDFLANGQVIGQSTSSPFSFTWTNALAGIYTLAAKAVDEIGATTTSTNSTVIAVGTGSGGGALIAWVSFHPADDTPGAEAAAAGFTRAADVGYTDLLKANGHIVQRIVTSSTPDVALLNAFDLVIISRSVSSGGYQEPASTAAWHSIKTPTMILGSYVLRNTRLGFTTGTTITDTTGPVKLTAVDLSLPLFTGVAFDANKTMVNTYADLVSFKGTPQLGISINTDPLADAGKVLATVGTSSDPTFGGMLIAEWQAGAMMANDSQDTLGGHRLIFLTGSEEQETGLTSQGAGIYDLFPDGAKLFLNAVSYMSGKSSNPTRPHLTISAKAGAVTIEWTGAGTLESSATIAPANWTTVPNSPSSPYNTQATGSAQFYRVRQ
jgi:hypothetical protein